MGIDSITMEVLLRIIAIDFHNRSLTVGEVLGQLNRPEKFLDGQKAPMELCQNNARLYQIYKATDSSVELSPSTSKALKAKACSYSADSLNSDFFDLEAVRDHVQQEFWYRDRVAAILYRAVVLFGYLTKEQQAEVIVAIQKNKFRLSPYLQPWLRNLLPLFACLHDTDNLFAATAYCYYDPKSKTFHGAKR
jgi:hypothetical protein